MTLCDITEQVKDAAAMNIQNSGRIIVSPMYDRNEHYIFVGKYLSDQDLIDRTPTMPFEEGKKRAIKWIAEGARCGIDMPYAKMKIRDPLMLSVMKYPCRGIRCSHNSCFDLEVFARFNFGKFERRIAESQRYVSLSTNLNLWVCPLCQKKALPDELRVCAFTKTLVEKAQAEDEEADDVRIYPDGSFEVHKVSSNKEAKRQSVASAKSLEMDSIILSSDEEDINSGDEDGESSGAAPFGQYAQTPLPAMGTFQSALDHLQSANPSFLSQQSLPPLPLFLDNVSSDINVDLSVEQQIVMGSGSSSKDPICL
jgi:hypothetical protein